MSRNILDQYTTDEDEVETSDGSVDLRSQRTMDDLCRDLRDLVPGLQDEDFREQYGDFTGLNRSAIVRLVEIFAELDRKDLLDEVGSEDG